MDTRHAPGNRESFRPAFELGTDTGPIDLVELVELRYGVSPRGHTSIGSIVSAAALFALLTVILLLAIATSGGWSVLHNY